MDFQSRLGEALGLGKEYACPLALVRPDVKDNQRLAQIRGSDHCGYGLLLAVDRLMIWKGEDRLVLEDPAHSQEETLRGDCAKKDSNVSPQDEPEGRHYLANLVNLSE